MQWHTLLISGFIVSIGVYVIAENFGSGAGNLFVVLLLLGVMIAQPTFATELKGLFK